MAMRYYRGVTLREMLRTNPQVVTEQWLCETLDPDPARAAGAAQRKVLSPRYRP
jgi:hypothetical protein